MTSPTVINVFAIHSLRERKKRNDWVPAVGYLPCFVSRKSRNQMMIRWVTLKAIFRGYPQLLRTNAGIRFQIRPSPPPSMSFLNNYSLRRYKPLYLQSLVVTICTTRFDDRKILRSSLTVHLCVLCESQNKQRLFPYTALTDWFL